MKSLKKLKYLFIIFFAIVSINSFAQGGPGDPPDDPEGGGDPVGGGGAPNTGHTVVMLALALTYAGKKVYDFTRRENSDIH
jgi:hypothetical protein